MCLAEILPPYRLLTASGQGIVNLIDAVSVQREDVLLGQHNSKQSRITFGRVLSDREAHGQLLDLPAVSDLTIAELLLRFMSAATGYYGCEFKVYVHFEKTIKFQMSA